MIVFFAFATWASTNVRQNESSANFCRQKWTFGRELNKRMFEACVDEQNEAWSALDQLKATHDNHAWFKTYVADGCRERWTKDAFTPPEMVAYCYRQEAEAFADLQTHRREAAYNAGGAEACFKVWQSTAGHVFGKTLECYRKRSEVPNYKLPRELESLL